jgi:O-antigen/teichoic acid export membrane protein
MQKIDTTAQNVLKNSIYNLIGFIIPIITLVVFTPIIIRNLGIELYGVYVFLTTVTTFLALLDLGIGTATNKHVIEYITTNDSINLSKLLHSMNSVYLVMGSVYFTLCIAVGFFIEFFWTNSQNQSDFIVLFSLVGLNGLLSSCFANFPNTLVALQRYDIHIKISSLIFISSNVIFLILAILGFKLVPILIGQLIVNFIGSLSYYVIGKKILPQLNLTYAWNRDLIIMNYKFALPIAFNNIANSSLVHFDKLIIPAFLGSSSLTFYSVPGSIATKISSISNTLSTLLFPITVNLATLNDSEKIERVYIRSFRLLSILAASIALSIFLISEEILRFWLGEEFVNQSYYVLILLTLTHFILAIYSPFTQILTAMNKLKFLTFGNVFMAVVNIVLLIILIPLYGIAGAALAYLISLLTVIWMLWYAEKKYFKLKTKRHYLTLLKIALTFIPFYLLVTYVISPLIINLATLIVLGPVCVVLFIALFKIFGFFEDEDWNDLVNMAMKVKKLIPTS